MLKRIEVTEPPKSAPQYMLESRMIAETGCMPKVSGSSSETPFGAPRPGSTPTKMPKSTPVTMRTIWLNESATSKPCISSEMFSIASCSSESEKGAEPPARHHDVEGPLEDPVEDRLGREDDRGRPPELQPVLHREGPDEIGARGHIEPNHWDRGDEGGRRQEQ